MTKNELIALALYLVLGPVIGCLLSGIDRKITARMQSRIGPPLLQPWYDMRKLLLKENLVARRSQNFYVFFYLIFMIFTGALFFMGGDLLLMVFALTLASIFMVLGAYKASSPYSFIGAERELLQVMAYEPMLLLVIVGLYMITDSFKVEDILLFQQNFAAYSLEHPKAVAAVVALKGIGLLLGLIYILTIKLRKSPFDLSSSHHAHQELVRGLTVEFSGTAMAAIEIAHWYETVIVLGLVYLFLGTWWWIALPATLFVFFLELVADNTCSRVKWQMAVKSSWIIAATLGVGNIAVLQYWKEIAHLFGN